MIQSAVVNTIASIAVSPIGPALVLLLGAAVQLFAGRWVRRPGWLTGLALFFLGSAILIFIALQYQGVVPAFGRPWQPLLQSATNLYWISDGWNYYISALILLLGGLGVLLNRAEIAAENQLFRLHVVLAMDLAVLGGTLFFVNSGNLLTALLTWVFLDLMLILRAAVEPTPPHSTQPALRIRAGEAQIVSLVGAMFLLMGVLPPGPGGLAQEFSRGVLPRETVVLMLLATTIRAGLYPFHLWLLPRSDTRLNISERLLNHMVPVMGGLWLLGWTLRLDGAALLHTPEILALMSLTLFASALAAWMAKDQLHHVTFVLITSAGVAALAGVLSSNPGPAGIIWAVTAFTLGGGLWLVGDQVWRAWGWQIPVSVGALALAGVPFTPGFLAQPALASMLSDGPAYWPAWLLYVLAQGMLLAALLRSWSVDRQTTNDQRQGYLVRLLAACLALGLPLAVSGFLPRFAETLVAIPNTIPDTLGNPPTVVAGGDVWLTLIAPLLLGFGLVWLRPKIWPALGDWPNRLSRISQLEWFFRLTVWAIDRSAQIGNSALRVVEGAGYVGWFIVILLIGLVLIR